MEFSERFGFSAAGVDLGIEEMPDTLRNALWDGCKLYYFQDISRTYDPTHSDKFRTIANWIWFRFFKRSTDTIPYRAADTLDFIRASFFSMEFWKVYNFLEFLAGLDTTKSPVYLPNAPERLTGFCNTIFERERAAFRFADLQLVKITSEEDRSAVESAIQQDKSGGVRAHISTAASLYSQTPTPDYRNSIKESISAVESAVGYVLDKKPNGLKDPLRTIADKFGMHHALRDGFIKLYGYTSDAEGIRHALMDEDNLTQEDARYMLVSCSAFANYLLALKARG